MQDAWEGGPVSPLVQHMLSAVDRSQGICGLPVIGGLLAAVRFHFLPSGRKYHLNAALHPLHIAHPKVCPFQTAGFLDLYGSQYVHKKRGENRNIGLIASVEP